MSTHEDPEEHWMAALTRLPEGLAARLTAPTSASRLEVDEEGQLLWRRFRHGRVLTDAGAEEAARRAQREARQNGRPILLLGVGEGALLSELLADGHQRVYAWDLDPALWRHVLRTHDLADALESGRCVPLLGIDLAHCVEARQAVVLEHPLFAAAYADARSLLEAERPLALMVQGELFVDDTAEALRAQGWRVLRWDIRFLSELENQHILSRSGARLAVAINTQEGLGEYLRPHGIELAIWEIDPNTAGPAPLVGPSQGVAVFSYRQVNLPRLRSVGYRRVHHLPLGAPVDRLARPVDASPPGEDYAVPIAFVGASMVESARGMQLQLRQLFDRRPDVLEKLGRISEIQRSDPQRWRIPALLETLLPGLRAQTQRQHDGLDIAMLLGEVSAAEKRLTWLAHLGPLGLHVWGDAGWSMAAAHGVTWRGWADHFTELPAIYAGAKIHVDVPRLYQQDAVAMRVFDVLAAGGFLLAEHSVELAELFAPGVELDTYRSPSELAAKCRFYLERAELRERIAAAGQARVRSEHTIPHRVGQILREMGLAARA